MGPCEAQAANAGRVNVPPTHNFRPLRVHLCGVRFGPKDGRRLSAQQAGPDPGHVSLVSIILELDHVGRSEPAISAFPIADPASLFLRQNELPPKKLSPLHLRRETGRMALIYTFKRILRIEI
jgi:hypothetical protein